MDTLTVELWSQDKKEAEFPIGDLDHMNSKQADDFWYIQEELLGRRVMLKYTDSTPVLEGASCTAQGLGDCHNVVPSRQSPEVGIGSREQ